MSEQSSPTRNAIRYVLIVLAAILGSYLFTLHSESIFACPASGYDSDTYLAYCHATHYGDYDHGAFWFGLEPHVRESATAAAVLLLGDSRLQFGFSSDQTNQWFSSIATPYYLMGFAYWENYNFEKQLLRRWQPAAKVYVINIDTYFEQTTTPPARIVMGESDAHDRYLRKQTWQQFHRQICARVSRFCANEQAFFRSRSTGAYLLKGGGVGRVPVTYDETMDPKKVREYTERGEVFLAGLPVDRKCIVFTIVPTTKTGVGTAKAIADALGVNLVAPELNELTTFDGSHMDRPSAERWSRAFFESAGPQIERCLGKTIVARS
jgi:hypothetical protein